jgi:hypothetical protein
LSPEERAVALAPFGFSKRQSRFLDLVMRHSGVCVQRQYATHAGIVHGQKTRAFFARLVRRGVASAFDCRHNRGRVYHIHHHALYSAIEAPNSRYRRPVSASRTPERLMMLDALLSGGDVVWLATRAELRNHFRSSIASSISEPPDTVGLRSSPVDGLWADSTRVGVDPSGRTVLLHLVLAGGCDDLRGFVGQCASVLSNVPTWTLRLVFPRSLTEAYESYQQVFREEWETPLQPHVLDELLWYFERRRSVPADRYPFPPDARFERAASTLRGARFDRLYRRWLRSGAAALNVAASPAISSALASGSGRVECLTLNHAYEHLSPVISSRGPTAAATEDGTDSVRAAAAPSFESIIQS